MRINFNNKDVFYGLLSGCLMGLSFPPSPFPYFMFAGLIPYFFAIHKRSGLASINRITYWTFFVFTIITLYWVGSWTKEADPFLILSGVLLMFFNPLLYLIPSSLYSITKKYLNPGVALILFPFFWVTFEYLYSVTEIRFPWLTLGHGLPYFKSFIQIADIIGAHGLSLIIVFVNVALFSVLKKYFDLKKISFIHLGFALLLIIIPIIYGVIKIDSYQPANKNISVGLIQPNFNPWKKWEAGILSEQLDQYLELSETAIDEGANIIIWPETALPVYLMTGSHMSTVNRIRNFISANNVYLLTGMPHAKFYDSLSAPYDAKRTSTGSYYRSYNSILAFQPGVKFTPFYGKSKLVPFGEKIPYVEYLPLIGDFFKWNVGISSWNVGRDTTVFTLSSISDSLEIKSEIKAGGLVCIESIYGDYVAQFVKKGAEFLFVVTNDSWYGNSSGPYQHAAIANLRAVENRRWVVRAANGGISSIVNPIGMETNKSKMFSKTALTGEIGLLSELTFYSKFPLLIPFSSLAISILIILIIVLKSIVKKRFNENEKNH